MCDCVKTRVHVLSVCTFAGVSVVTVFMVNTVMDKTLEGKIYVGIYVGLL